MRLHHTTNQEAYREIAAVGLRDGEEGYVHLTDEIWSWRQNWMVSREDFDALGRNEVVLAYDVPDHIAAVYERAARPVQPDDPDYDPEMDIYSDDEIGPNDVIWREYHIPAAVANQYFAGVIHPANRHKNSSAAET